MSRRTWQHTCVTCGQPFTSTHPRSKACSDACRFAKNQATWNRYRTRVREGQRTPRAEQWCCGCRQTLPASAFGPNNARVSGLQDRCRPCRAIYDQRPDQQEKAKARKHAWYLDHYEAYLARNRARYQEDHARYYARNRAYWEENREAILEHRRKQYAEKRAWEAADARRCVCGKALPPDGDRWFCRAACKIALIRSLRVSPELPATLLTIRQKGDEPRLTREEEALLKKVATKTAALWKGKGLALDGDDLVSCAYYGAWRAFLDYDSARGCALQSWLITGARREVLEALRAVDPLSRAERKAYKERAAKDPDTPLPRVVVSLDAVVASTPEEADPLVVGDRLACDEDIAEGVVSRVDAEAQAARILSLLGTARLHEAEVVRLHGMEGLTMKQVAGMLGISQSRVSQVWQAACERIREALAA